jgi:hypothetical protein
MSRQIMHEYKYLSEILPNTPDFASLPWEYELNEWLEVENRVEEIQHGISRHPVVFVNFDGALYVIKELPAGIASKEHEILTQMQNQAIPSVISIGHGSIQRNKEKYSLLFTRYLETSVPFRSLFIGNVVNRFQETLLDAISGLLVQLHSNGFYWGDCSLSNILFRRDAGALQAYLVDAETAEKHSPNLSPILRYQDLEIMQENIRGELSDLQTYENLSPNYPIEETGSYIQQRYRALWEEINREEVFRSDELYRVQERIHALNELGFSVKDIVLTDDGQANNLKLRIFVSDRNFHRNQLMEMTGLFAEEHQAQQIINEINEMKANFNRSDNTNMTIEAVAYYWLEHVYKPVIEQLKPILSGQQNPELKEDPVELYCQILEHKWYLSERAQHDVGHQVAADDFISQFSG